MKKSIHQYKRSFLIYLEKARGYSDLTLKTYDEALSEAFQSIVIEEKAAGTLFDLMPYRIKIASLKQKTIAKKLSAVRSFAEYLNTQGEHITLKADDSIKVAKTLPKPIPHEHIMEALQTAQTDERLIVIMLYTLGLRISELANLKLEDIENEWIRVVGKGNKQRDVPLLASTSRILREYVDEMRPKKYLFEKNSRKLSENSLRYSVTKVFKRAALKVTPHQLRHSYATVLLNNNARIADVSELLGHSSMATTQIYTKLGSALKMQNYNKAHPLCKETDDTF
ncbi:tyrosine-type recombinase/integrase [Sulfurimonas sp. HSL-1716]|uniref:tyrosine-type recombinase/integrase n=1 Tax=Hydrocurvibacter sulfurireducens TaxID=3131937 RepID=UPI0031F9699A